MERSTDPQALHDGPRGSFRPAGSRRVMSATVHVEPKWTRPRRHVIRRVREPPVHKFLTAAEIPRCTTSTTRRSRRRRRDRRVASDGRRPSDGARIRHDSRARRSSTLITRAHPTRTRETPEGRRTHDPDDTCSTVADNSGAKKVVLPSGCSAVPRRRYDHDRRWSSSMSIREGTIPAPR